MSHAEPVSSSPGAEAAPGLNLSEEEFVAAVEHQPRPLVIPLSLERPIPRISPLTIYAGLPGQRGFLLESMEGSEKMARYSFLGKDPDLTVTFGEGGGVGVEGREPLLSIARSPDGGNAIDGLASLLRRFHFMNLKAPRYFGGMVGCIGYDVVHDLVPKVRRRDKPGADLPLAQFMMARDCIVLDHIAGRIFIFSSPVITYDSDPGGLYRAARARISSLDRRIREMEDEGDEFFLLPGKTDPLSRISRVPRQAFEKAVREVKEHILAGDIFQAVISRKIECPLQGDPFRIYRALRMINPSPYMFYLDFGDLKIVGSSPEMLVRVERGKVTTVPIAGTRLRGKTPEEDERLAEELRSDEKERAEHLMLVDLARNDVGRVSRFGSVKVDEFMAVERFSHVQHLVSTVQGTLSDHLTPFDALKSCFPAGTVSGAPKVRAMEIIEALEPERRGLYAGAVGYAGFDRTLEFAITIRTIVIRGRRAEVQVGAGIVADSDPGREWEETENKGMALIRAIELVEGSG
ncbi:MAG: anthranilate synthase component I family protein [Methanomicrobiales archaeon]|nr:anthranilate synthase component I family protein [Methanomicrobiales archaeon]